MRVKSYVRHTTCMVLAALLHNAVHEGTHYLAATALGEEVLEFRFLTNGWGTSQVIFATSPDARFGLHWLVIAWLPAVLTVFLGYAVFLGRKRLISRVRYINLLVWYVGFLFLLLDPFYFAVLSLITGGDIEAAAAVGWAMWPLRLAASVILALNVRLMVHWRREAVRSPDLY